MNSHWHGSILVLLSAVCYGFLPIFARFAYAGGAEVQELLFVRFVVSFLIIGTFLIIVRGMRLPSRRQLVILIGLGAVGYFLQSSFYFLSLLYVPVAVTALVLYTYPAFVTTTSFALGFERASLRVVASLALALIGLALVANPALNLDAMGVIFAFAAAITYTCFILISSRELKDVKGELSTFYIMGGSAVSFGIYGSAMGGLGIGWGMDVWLWVVMISVISTCLALTLFFRGLRIIGPSRTSILSTMELITSVVVAAIVFKELITFMQLVGGAMILIAAILAALSEGRA